MVTPTIWRQAATATCRAVRAAALIAQTRSLGAGLEQRTFTYVTAAWVSAESAGDGHSDSKSHGRVCYGTVNAA